MAEATDLSSEEFMKLLTDALRNGPGSPEWHQAVAVLGKCGSDADEYRQLVEAREHLESGKGYRQIRAGPVFTRKVMDGIERPETGRPRRMTLASIIVGLSTVVIVGTIAVVLYLVWPRPANVEEMVQRLGGTQWTEGSATSKFDGPLDSSWRKVGTLNVATGAGLKPGPAPSLPGDEYRGGGIVSAAALPADEPLAMQADVRVLKPGDEVITQIFVTNGTLFTPEKATSDHELVVQIKGSAASVALPDGRIAAQFAKAAEGFRDPFAVRIAMNKGVCIVDVAGKRLWAGEHQLGGDAPRYVGVRFLRKGKGTSDVVVIESVQLLKAVK
jgi:hypothetical protein